MTLITTPVNPRSTVVIRPPSPWRRRLGTVGGLVVLALLVYGIIGLLRGGSGTGEITFGHALNDSHEVSVQEQVFHPGDQFIYSASLTESVEASEVRLRVTVVDADGQTDTTIQHVEGDSEGGNILSSLEAVEITSDMAGSWTIEVLKGNEVLASGSFTVAEE